MPTVPISMRKLTDILRLKFEAKLSNRQIAESLTVSPSTISYYLNRAAQLGIKDWPLGTEWTETHLKAKFQSTRVVAKETRFALPDWQAIKKALTNKNLTLQLLWEEYADENTPHYSYSHFCRLYETWLGTQKLSMRQTHFAGEKLFVDYCGPTVPIVDPQTHETRHAQIFVAVMGATSYSYVEATYTQGLEDWIMSHVRCFEFLGGVPAIIVPDNLKSAVTKASRYEPDLNPSYQQLARYYRTTVIPARPYKPKDKAKAEVGVQVVERWILARLRHETFYSLAQLNTRIQSLLSDLNHRPLKQYAGSRASRFQSIDAPALQPLPQKPYCFTEIKKVRVPADYHVEVKQHYYSVPYQLVKCVLDAHVVGQLVEIYHKGELVALHPRSYQHGGHTTDTAHQPPNHQAHARTSQAQFEAWASEIGIETTQVVQHYFSDEFSKWHAHRSCRGLQQLAKQFGAPRLNQACLRGLQTGAITYKSLQTILHKGLDKVALPGHQTESVIPTEHANLRGKQYYH